MVPKFTPSWFSTGHPHAISTNFNSLHYGGLGGMSVSGYPNISNSTTPQANASLTPMAPLPTAGQSNLRTPTTRPQAASPAGTPPAAQSPHGDNPMAWLQNLFGTQNPAGGGMSPWDQPQQSPWTANYNFA